MKKINGVDLYEVMRSWGKLGNVLMLSQAMAGERIVSAVAKTELTFDDVGRLADMGGALKARGIDPVDILSTKIHAMQKQRTWHVAQ